RPTCGGESLSVRCCRVPSSRALSHAGLEAGFDESEQVAVEHGLRIAGLQAGAKVLDAGLVQHVRSDLAAPADIGLGVLELLVLLALLLKLELVQPRLEHFHGGR